MATEGKRIAQKIMERYRDCGYRGLHEPSVAALIDAELEAERKAVDELLQSWRLLRPHVWETSFTDVDYEHSDYTRAVMGVDRCAASLRKMRGSERISENRNLEKTK